MRSVTLLGLLCATFGSRAYPQNASQEADVFGSAIQSFVSAQQDAVSAGDPDRILSSSVPVAVASLALLNSVDVYGQEQRKAVEALPYAQGLLAEMPTELMLLRMELNLGEIAHAAALKKHIVSTNPENAALHLALADIFQQRSEFGEAIGEAQRAVELEPKSRDAQTALGMAYWGLNGFQYNEETLQAFSTARQLDPDNFSTNFLLGSIESQYHRFDDAAEHLRASIAADSSAAEPWYQLGMNAYEQSRTDEADELLQHYLSLIQAAKKGKLPQIRLALLTLDEIAAEKGKTPDTSHRAAEDALKQQILQTTSAGSETFAMGSTDAGDQALAPGKTEAPKATSATIAQLREMAANALGNIGSVLAQKNDYAAAIVPLRYATAEDPSLESVTRNFGLVACIVGSYEESVQTLKEVVAAHPDDAAARGYLGAAEFEKGNYSDAAATFAPLGQELASMPLFQATAAAAFARAGDRARAQEALADLKNVDSDPQLQAREAIAYLDLGDADQAADLAKAALSEGNEAPADALRVLGLLDLERGDASKAVAEFQAERKAGREGTENEIESHALLAEALIEAGKKFEGEALAAKLVHASPNVANTLFHQGQMLLRNGNVHAAFEKFAAARALAPHEKQIRAAFDSAKHALSKSD